MDKQRRRVCFHNWRLLGMGVARRGGSERQALGVFDLCPALRGDISGGRRRRAHLGGHAMAF